MEKMVSIVVPLYNEEENVKKLHQKISEVIDKNRYNTEVIFVDDGSKDKTLAELKKLTDLKIIQLRRNFGQTSAFDAGIKEAKGDIIITMDGDLQNDPRDIPKMIKKLDQGHDVVVGWRKKRRDDPMKNLVSRGAYLLRQVILGDKVHDSGCSLKVFRRECFENLNLLGEEHRLIPALLSWKGFRVTEIPVKHHKRKKGKTKYGWKRMIKGLIDMIGIWFWWRFSSRPLHLFGGLGILSFMIGFLGLIALFILRILAIVSLSDRIWPIIAIFLMLAGIQLFITGFLADIMIKNYYKDRKLQAYSIRKIINRKIIEK